MPFAINRGVHIHYEVEGQGLPLVLQHGHSSNLGSWRQLGYVDALKNSYRLILIDARGHGASDKPHDPEAYRQTDWARDVTVVLDELGVTKTHFYGYSMGAMIAFCLARHAPGRLLSLVAGEAAPLDGDLSEPTPTAKAHLALLRLGPEAYVATFDPKYRSFFPPDDIDIEALTAARLSTMRQAGLADAMRTLEVPCLLFCGENDNPSHDNARKLAETMPNATFVSIPGANHVECAFLIDQVLPHVRRFLAEASRV